MDTMPTEIRRVEDREVHVAWADGHRTVYTNRQLRETCPCAACVNELTGERMLDPRTVRPDIRAEEIGLVGRYAVKIRWSDGHATGIYTFRSLRAGCPCAACHGTEARAGA
jgi:ATP-binding protein involved in chromosome partitioning